MGKYKKELDIICRHCGKLKHVPAFRDTKRLYFKKGYCSRRCQKLAELIEKKCQYCGKEFFVKNNRKETARFCSRRCYYESKKGKVVNQMFGSDNPKWNPNKKTRTYPSSYLKNKVKERDGWKCYICGSGENLHVHHLVSFKEICRHKSSNLLTLCHDCHWRVHRKQYFITKSYNESLERGWGVCTMM